MPTSSSLTLFVQGTHCAACKLVLEDSLPTVSGVHAGTINLREQTAHLTIDPTISIETLIQALNAAYAEQGYTFTQHPPGKKTRLSQDVLSTAIPLGLLVLALFFLLQKSGWLALDIDGTIGPLTSFTLGIIASLSTCLAIVGGLVLSISARATQAGLRTTRPLLLFHAGRLASFALFGGLVGILGGLIGVGGRLTAALGLLASIVMMVLGLRLLGFKSAPLATLSPSFFRRWKNTAETAPLSGFFLGVGTFFLPCGFTQSMQIVALSSGSFFQGALIMTAFALGTLPVLTGLSFGSRSLGTSTRASLFFATTGVVVIGLSLLGILSGLTALGVLPALIQW
ncbi:sulfite exporter TauE/SafE family protein [Patescibacteria group bacterium]|nr:sulfite exporter TauE/SafE family protein [Patescibacteria group bacterium]